ncbi:MAG: dienelactone hydrolase family protein [Bacteroidetes bacterium]|nr:dienelactone hydrolase family protein [Bacteroidota bacterium]
MMRMYAVVSALLAFASLASAQNIRTMNVTYQSGKDTVSAYMAMPEGSGKHPALIVIHEWWGLRDWIRRDARDLARHGYVALAIDLYRGQITDNPKEAYKLMLSVPKERAVTDLKAAFDYLSGMKEVNPSKIGVIGWCMGGSYSYIAAVNLPKLAACVINYGNVGTTKSEVEPINCPVLCNFAEKDMTYTAKMGKAFVAAMKADGKTAVFHEYAGVNHAFMNPNNPGVYDEAQAKLAWKRIYSFFDAHLKK